jgi:CubicO group peptidase (beta-lactamase class C family)
LAAQDLQELVEEERARFGVPGVAVAVVHGGQVLLSGGAGHVGHMGPAVDERTAFPLASDTKAVTGTVLALLHSRGSLDLDAPVQRTLPWFRLGDPVRSACTTTRDLLAHRSGLARHDLLWGAHPAADVDEMTRKLADLEVNLPFRHAWQYTNLGYVAAGHVAEVATRSRWDDLVEELVLSPLGKAMTITVPVPELTLARPHRERDGTTVLTAMPVTSSVRPAGGLVTTAADLARWLLARLGHRPEVLTDSVLVEAHTPAMVGGLIPPWPERHALGYALGSQVESYRGHRLLHHGGNLMGYASDVFLLPDADIGVAVLTNLQGSALRNALPLRLIDALLGLPDADWGQRYQHVLRQQQARVQPKPHAPSAHALGETGTRPDLTGTYTHPAYGELRIERRDDGVVVRLADLPLEMALAPTATGWDLVLAEFDKTAPVQLANDESDAPMALLIPLEPTTSPIRFTSTAGTSATATGGAL